MKSFLFHRCGASLAAMIWFGLALAPVCRAGAGGCRHRPSPAFINTWLVLGTFPNTPSNTGLGRAWIPEATASPEEGAVAGGHTWRYFDDHLFSRNYDNYQDLFSYFHIERRESVAAKVAYAFTYLYTPRARNAQLRMAADTSAKAWLNGQVVTRFLDGSGRRQDNRTNVALRAGWNRLLLKIANSEDGRFGFYARVCARSGDNLPGLVISPDGPGDGQLQVETKAMADIRPRLMGLTKSPDMPIGWRSWPYVGAQPDPNNPVFDLVKGGALTTFIADRNTLLQASNFQFAAQGGTPPYDWNLGAHGGLPPGLSLQPNGTITGTISPYAKLGTYHFTVWVMDAGGKLASKRLSIIVRPRPNKWYEEARLVGLMEGTGTLEPAEIPPYVRILKREGYQAVMVKAFNNGGMRFWYPTKFSRVPVERNYVAPWKEAVETQGMRFGVYMGNITNLPGLPFSSNQAVLVLQQVMQRFHPAVLWFDWSGLNAVSPDAMFSAIRTLDPKTVIVLNGAMRGSTGDWDEICFEGWGAWGSRARAWGVWPRPIPWPLKNSPEAWRLMVQPGWGPYNPTNILSSWKQMLRIQISLIGAGFVADVDAIPWLGGGPSPLPLGRMPEVVNHDKMADWANPSGMPPLYPSFTWVNPGPLHPASWGYDVINLRRNVIYLHILKNPRGKTGLPGDRTLTVRPVTERVKDVVWMNANKPLKFAQHLTQTDHGLTIDTTGVKPSRIDTVIRIDLEHPLPRPSLVARRAVPAGNLAYRRPARLLSADGSRVLPPSVHNRARYGVDGDLSTCAEAANDWAWAYQVDLQRLFRIGRIDVIFTQRAYATEYNILLSVNGLQWKQVAHLTTNHGGAHVTRIQPTLARYVRIQAVKPDGPGQPGAQMAIAELRVFAANEKP